MPPNTSTSAPNPRSSNIPDFISKLYNMLSDPGLASIVSWAPSGLSFMVHDPSEFSKFLLPQNFKHNNFASFVRQLNKYDFHKVKASMSSSQGQEQQDSSASGQVGGGLPQQSWEFSHSLFQKGRPDLLDKIKRKLSSTAVKKREAQSLAARHQPPLLPASGTSHRHSHHHQSHEQQQQQQQQQQQGAHEQEQQGIHPVGGPHSSFTASVQAQHLPNGGTPPPSASLDYSSGSASASQHNSARHLSSAVYPSFQREGSTSQDSSSTLGPRTHSPTGQSSSPQRASHASGSGSGDSGTSQNTLHSSSASHTAKDPSDPPPQRFIDSALYQSRNNHRPQNNTSSDSAQQSQQPSNQPSEHSHHHLHPSHHPHHPQSSLSNTNSSTDSDSSMKRAPRFSSDSPQTGKKDTSTSNTSSGNGSPSASTQMREQLDTLQQSQQEMALRLKSLSFNYQRSTDKMEAMEKTMSKQEELIRTLVDVVAKGDPALGALILASNNGAALSTESQEQGSTQGQGQGGFQTLGRVAAVIPASMAFGAGSTQQSKENLEAILARYASIGLFDSSVQALGQQQIQQQQQQIIQQQQQLHALQQQNQFLQSQLPGMPLASVMTPSPQQEPLTPQQTQQQQQVLLDTVFSGIPFAQQQQQQQQQLNFQQQQQQAQAMQQQPLQYYNPIQQQQLALQQLQQQHAQQLQPFLQQQALQQQQREQQNQQQQQHISRKSLSQMAPQWTAPPKVLLVEDDDTCRRLSSKLLQIFGCNFDIAVDGLDAVNRMGVGYKYDIVLMDIMMPNLDGVSATTRIRQFDKSTPIISMTSNITDADCMTYLANGMNDVLPKPFNKKTLLGIIQRYCAHRSDDDDEDLLGLPRELLVQSSPRTDPMLLTNDAGEKIQEVEDGGEEDDGEEVVVPVSTNGGVRPASLLPPNTNDPIALLPEPSRPGQSNGQFDDQFMDLLRMSGGEGSSSGDGSGVSGVGEESPVLKDLRSKKRVRRGSN